MAPFLASEPYLARLLLGKLELSKHTSVPIVDTEMVVSGARQGCDIGVREQIKESI